MTAHKKITLHKSLAFPPKLWREVNTEAKSTGQPLPKTIVNLVAMGLAAKKALNP